MMENDAGSDQLRELFNMCAGSSGLLDQSGLPNNEILLDERGLDQLCGLLQLGDSGETELIRLIKEGSADHSQISFSNFKTSFISFLTGPIPQTTEATLHSSNTSDCVTPNTLTEDPSVIEGDNPDSLPANTAPCEEAVSPTKRQRCRSGSSGSTPRPTHLSTNLFSDYNENQANTSVDIEKQYWDIWVSLGIGQNGYLTRDELVIFCGHTWKDQPQGDVDALFTQLDRDNDGRIGFQEFIHGLYDHKCHNQESKGSPPNKKQRKCLPSPNGDDEEQNPEEENVTQNCLFTSLTQLDSSGLASPDKVTNLWEEMDVGNTTAVLMNLGFDPTAKVNLHDLSHRLDQEVTKVIADSSSVALHAAVASYQHELQHLRSLIDHLLSERSKLRKDLTDSTTRNNLLLHEVDEQQDSIQKAADKDIQKLREDYERRIKQLNQELAMERERLNEQPEEYTDGQTDVYDSHDRLTVANRLERERLNEETEEYTGGQTDVNDSHDRLSVANRSIERLETLLEGERDKTMYLERTVARLDTKLKECENAKKELTSALANASAITQSESDREMLHEFETQNKRLKDEIDEKSAELEELRHKVVLMMRQQREQSSIHGSPLVRYLPIHQRPNISLPTHDSVMQFADETSYDFDGSFEIDAAHQSPTEDPIDLYCNYNTMDKELSPEQIHLDDELDIDCIEADLFSGAESPIYLHEQLLEDNIVADLKDEMVRVRLELAETQQRKLELIDELSETRTTLEESRHARECLANKNHLLDTYVEELREQVKSLKQKMSEYDVVIRGFYTENAKKDVELAKCDKLRSEAVMETTNLTSQNTSLRKVIQRLRDSFTRKSTSQRNSRESLTET